MAAWRQRVARDDNGQLFFVHARYDTSDPQQRCGILPAGTPLGGAKTIEEMHHFAEALLQACDEPIISTREYEREPDEDDEDEGDDD